MLESDQSDKETQDERPALEVPNKSLDTNVPTQKRIHEDSSGDEKLHSVSKKLCTSTDKVTTEDNNTEYIPEVNGSVKDVNEYAKNINTTDDKDDAKCTSMVEESTGSDTKESHDLNSENENEEECINTNDDVKTKIPSETSMDSNKDNVSTESDTNVDAKGEITKKEKTEKGDDNSKQKKKHGKSQIQDSEVVEGLELSVECASDKETSSSESEDETDKKPKPKTIIVKAKPNDSELDVSSSEAEKSDSQDATEVLSKQNAKKEKKRGRTSFSKTKVTDSEENDDISDEDYSPRTKKKLKKTTVNKKAVKLPSESKRGRGSVKKATQNLAVKDAEEKEGHTSSSKANATDSEENDSVSDEDYSPQTKRKLKKTVSKKVTKSSSESKRGRGAIKTGAQKSVAKEMKEKEKDEDEDEEKDEEEEKEEQDEEEDAEKEAENPNTIDNKKTEESPSDEESAKSKSENENDSDNSKNEKQKPGTQKSEDKRIESMKKFIRAAGIHVKSYNELWAGCKTIKAKVMCLKELLEKNGVFGRPTLEKCRTVKRRNEKLKDVAELSTSNIISEGRVTRAQRNKDSNKEVTRTPETPTKHREARNSFKRVLRVVDSDSE
ncbi:DNA ligase 1-like [Colletes gigas]|uniref:DNA ligase 1-like n=1 Tax=Colletes gigas TaxID=935657 RepID=UPI001C9AE5CD|nr:DNA ligase 1-like [Colletes gigas]